MLDANGVIDAHLRIGDSFLGTGELVARISNLMMHLLTGLSPIAHRLAKQLLAVHVAVEGLHRDT